MKIEYFPETDTLHISFNSKPGADAREIAPDTVLDFDAKGNVIGIGIEHASKKLDLKSIEIEALPIAKLKIK